jgi:SAM-dependent methyltransferase
MLRINIGCGRKLRKDCLNVDAIKYPGVDKVVNLGKYPWPWKTGSVDMIYASHVIEHLPSQEKFIKECLRVLKKGGKLRLNVPHSSCVTNIGCMGHNRTYAYNTLHGYLGMDFYMFGKAKFKTTYRRLNWWFEAVDCQEELPKWTRPTIKGIDFVISGLANLCPRFWENVICPTIQMREVIWEGEKL